MLIYARATTGREDLLVGYINAFDDIGGGRNAPHNSPPRQVDMYYSHTVYVQVSIIHALNEGCLHHLLVHVLSQFMLLVAE